MSLQGPDDVVKCKTLVLKNTELHMTACKWINMIMRQPSAKDRIEHFMTKKEKKKQYSPDGLLKRHNHLGNCHWRRSGKMSTTFKNYILAGDWVNHLPFTVYHGSFPTNQTDTVETVAKIRSCWKHFKDKMVSSVQVPFFSPPVLTYSTRWYDSNNILRNNYWLQLRLKEG